MHLCVHVVVCNIRVTLLPSPSCHYQAQHEKDAVSIFLTRGILLVFAAIILLVNLSYERLAFYGVVAERKVATIICEFL